jgi:hypothetical protein
MSRVLNASVLVNKSLVEAAVLALLVIAALLLVHQMHQVSAADANPAVHSLVKPGISVQSIQSAQSSTAEDSFNSDSSSADAGSANSGSAHTSVTINGQTVPVPQNGTVSRTIQNQNGTTKVEVDSSSTGTSANSSNSSVNVQVDSSSNTAVHGDSQ